jgi:hypothetical protein
MNDHEFDFKTKTYWEEMKLGKRSHDYPGECEQCRQNPSGRCALLSLLSWILPMTDSAKADPKI